MGEGLVGTKVGHQAYPAVPVSPPWGHLPWHPGTCGSLWCFTQPISGCPPGRQVGDGGPGPAPGSLSPSLSFLPPQILHRYDMVLVQEVRDADLSAVTQLMEQLNRYEQSQD